MFYPDGEFRTKANIKKFMREKNAPLFPEFIIKYIYRHMSLADATAIMDDLVKTDSKIEKQLTANNEYVYYYKFVEKKRYF